jgi:outer membrane cobalamin receptor
MEITELIAARLAFKYQRADNVPLYEEQVTASGTPAGQWDIDYSGTTRIFGLDAEVSAELTPESYALVSIAWRGTENSVTGHALPYAPAFQAGATYRHIFPIGLTLQTDLNIFGPQFADRSASQTLNGYTLWGVSAEYEVIPQLGVGVAFENLLGQDYQRWNGYESIPQTAMLFGRYRW